MKLCEISDFIGHHRAITDNIVDCKLEQTSDTINDKNTLAHVFMHKWVVVKWLFQYQLIIIIACVPINFNIFHYF